MPSSTTSTANLAARRCDCVRICIALLMAISAPLASGAEEPQTTVTTICNRGGYFLPIEEGEHWGLAVFIDASTINAHADMLAKVSRIRSLTLSNGLISDSTCAKIGAMPDLGEITFLTADCSSAGLRSIGNAPNLKRLTFAKSLGPRNEGISVLTSIPSIRHIGLGTDAGTVNVIAELRKCQTLMSINLAWSQLAGHWDILKDLNQIQDLTANGPSVTDEAIFYIGKMTQLRSLNISSSSISPDGIRQLKALINCEELSLQGKNVNDSTLSVVGQLRQLRSLEIYASRMSGEQLGELKKLPHLHSLSISHCNLSQRGFFNCCQIKQLKSLSVTACFSIRDGMAEELASLHQLEHLNFRFTPIGDQTCSGIAKSAQLESLDLSGTRITTEGAKHLGTLKKLRKLNIITPSISMANLSAGSLSPSLEQLAIKVQSGSTNEINQLAQLPKLRALSIIKSTGVSLDQGGANDFTPLAKMQSLRFLVVEDFSLGRDQCIQLLKNPQLTHLYVLDCRITEAGRQLLEAGRPNLLVFVHGDPGQLRLEGRFALDSVGNLLD